MSSVRAAAVTHARPPVIARRAWQVLAAALVAQVGVSVVEQGIPTLTGFIKQDLGVSAAAAGLLVSCFTLGKVLASYVAGVAADRIGERLVLFVGVVATGALVFVGAFASLPGLVVLLVLAGIASASATPAGGRFVLLAFPHHRRALALSARQTGIPIGGLVAAGVLPLVAHAFGWRTGLACAGAIAAISAFPLVAVPTTDRGDAVSVPGAARRSAELRLLTLWGCLLVSGQYAVLPFFALDLHQRALFSLTSASLLLAVAQASGVVGRLAWGAFSDHRGGDRRRLLVAMTLLALGASSLLFAMPGAAPMWAFGLVAAFVGVALLGYQGLWITMIAEAAGPERAGRATGMAVTFVSLSIAASPPLWGLLADSTSSYRAIWCGLDVVLACALVPALLLRRHA